MGNGQRRSDIYSLGATLLFAATGAHPSRQDSLEALALKLTVGANCGRGCGGCCGYARAIHTTGGSKQWIDV